MLTEGSRCCCSANNTVCPGRQAPARPASVNCSNLAAWKETFVLNYHLNSVPFRKYASISSLEQRQSYKNDFNAEYNEYRDLHARIERITRRFTQLDSQLKQLSQGSEEYKV